MMVPKEHRRSKVLSVAIFVIAVAGMAYLRLYLFPNIVVTLGYGLPLLACLWHRDRVLLWSMAGAFAAMATYKALFLLPDPDPTDHLEGMQLLMQITNIAVTAGTVHWILNLTGKLNESNAELHTTVEELAARDEEISRQNEELQTQSEELQHQNEELQQQAEKLGQQAEELEAQSHDLQKKNSELVHRETALHGMLQLLHGAADESKVLQQICQSLVDLCGAPAAAAAVTQQEDTWLRVRASAGHSPLLQDRWNLDQSFAAVVMGENRTAFIADLAARPDLVLPQSHDCAPRSVLATPLHINSIPVGAVEVYATRPHEWTTEDVRIIEWIAAKCSLVIETSRLNAQVKQTREDLERLVAERTASLQELVNELEHFSYTITHDMRAPLRAMRGFASMLEEDAGESLNETCKGYLHRISSAAGRMDLLITDALSYSQAVRAKPVMTRVEPDQLLRDMIDSYPEFQPLKESIRIEGDMPPVLGNEAGLTQCFSNLLTNAIKFVRPGQQPNVSVRGEQVDGVVRIWVEDEGIGIPPEMMPRMFGMFQRASKSYEGTGIGLALVRKVTERMGGRVGVEPGTHKGSRFWIELKAAEGHTE